MSSDQVLLGRLTKNLPRTGAHSRYVNSLLKMLNDYSPRRGGKPPQIRLDQELREHDRVVIEGEYCWSSELNQLVSKHFPNVQIERTSETKVELYVPVVGNPYAFAWKDFVASLSVASLCGYLLYYFVL